jgi:hypothetical protein
MGAFSLKRPLLAGAAFSLAALAVSVGYAAYSGFSASDYAYPSAGGSTTLSAAMWNKVVGNVDDLNTRMSNFAFSGGKVGIGTANPVARVQVQNASGQSIWMVLSNNDYNANNLGTSLNLYSGTGSGPTYAGIQAINSGSLAGPLALNPSSGNVGIGTTGP